MPVSLWNAVKNIISGFFRGFKDSLLGFYQVFYYDTPPKESKAKLESELTSLARQRAAQKHKQAQLKSNYDESKSVKPAVKKIFLVNCAMFGTTFIAFYFLLLPCLGAFARFITDRFLHGYSDLWATLEFFVELTFNTFWLAPIFLIMKVINFFWYQDVAVNAYQQRQGKPYSSASVGTVIADNVFSFCVQIFFLIQAGFVAMSPFPNFVNIILAAVHMSLLNSLYSFEYSWSYMGWNLDRRLRFIEVNWPYFLGFGFLPSFVTLYTESLVVSAALFTVLFPIFIISANEAVPLCADNGCALRLFVPAFYVVNRLAQYLARKETPASTVHKSFR